MDDRYKELELERELGDMFFLKDSEYYLPILMTNLNLNIEH